jgi:hypothetical protein
MLAAHLVGPLFVVMMYVTAPYYVARAALQEAKRRLAPARRNPSDPCTCDACSAVDVHYNVTMTNGECDARTHARLARFG